MYSKDSSCYYVNIVLWNVFHEAPLYVCHPYLCLEFAAVAQLRRTAHYSIATESMANNDINGHLSHSKLVAFTAKLRAHIPHSNTCTTLPMIKDVCVCVCVVCMCVLGWWRPWTE